MGSGGEKVVVTTRGEVKKQAGMGSRVRKLVATTREVMNEHCIWVYMKSVLEYTHKLVCY